MSSLERLKIGLNHWYHLLQNENYYFSMHVIIKLTPHLKIRAVSENTVEKQKDSRCRQTDRGARWQTGVRLSHLLDGFAGREVEAVISLCFTVANDEQVVLIRQPLLGTAKWREGQKGEKKRKKRALEFSGGRVGARLHFPRVSGFRQACATPLRCLGSGRPGQSQGPQRGRTPAPRPSGGIDWG